MRAPEIFAWLVGFTFAMVLVGGAFGSRLGFSVTPPDYSQYMPPSQIYNYTPGNAITNWGTDVVWGINMITMWFENLDEKVGALLGSLWVTDPLLSLLVATVAISFAGFIIYIITSRVIFEG